MVFSSVIFSLILIVLIKKKLGKILNIKLKPKLFYGTVGLKKSNAKFFQKIRGVTFKLNICDYERFICQSFVEKTLIRLNLIFSLPFL